MFTEVLPDGCPILYHYLSHAYTLIGNLDNVIEGACQSDTVFGTDKVSGVN